MIEYLVSLSILTCFVLLIRGLFRKAISPRVVYALWLVVVIRMLLPISLFEADITLPEFLQNREIEQTETQPAESEASAAGQTTPDISFEQSVLTTPMDGTVSGTPVIPTSPAETQPTTSTATDDAADAPIVQQSPVSDTTEVPLSVNWSRIADLAWFCGAVIASLWVLLTGIAYTRQLQKDRILYKTVRGIKVYISVYAGVPCIVGLIPSIYITPEAANSKSETLILIHEYTHLRHGDHIWAVVRALALIVFWWNPLVWIAAMVSKQDAELACDDAIAARLDEETRLRYAHILLDTIPQKHRYADRPGSVYGFGSAPMKERILMLTKKRKNKGICVILAIMLAGCAIGCSFVGMRRVTMDNIQTQKGFTIVSQKTQDVTLTLPMEQIPTYDAVVSAEDAHLLGLDVPVFSTDTTEVFLHTVGVSDHDPEGTEKDVLYLGFDIRHTLSDHGTIYTVFRVKNDNGRNTHSVAFSVPMSTLLQFDRQIKKMGDGPGDQFFIYIDAALYAALQGDVEIGITLNEIVYARGDEVRIYGEEPVVEEEGTVSSSYLEIPEIVLTQVDGLPYDEDTAIFKDAPVGGSPTIFFFGDSLTFYFRNYLPESGDYEYFTGVLTLPNGFWDAALIDVSRGVGSGEIFVSVLAVYHGEEKYLSYQFFGMEPPKGAEVLSERQTERLLERIESASKEQLPTEEFDEEFDPQAFAELIPNPAAELVLYHRFMASDTYIYLCAIHEWNSDGTWSTAPPKDFAVYYTQDFGKTIGMVDMKLPDDLAYDTVTPVLFGLGGGSMELQIILRLTAGDTAFYVSFDNFSYSGDDYLGFDYRGQVADETIDAYKQLQIGTAIGSNKVQNPISIDGEWYHNYRHSGGYAFYLFSMMNDTAEMMFDHGAYESEYANRYRGTYTVDPATTEITALLHDTISYHENTQMTLKFTLDMPAEQNSETLVMHIISCDAPDYRQLVGQTLTFRKDFGYTERYTTLLYEEAQAAYQRWYDGEMTIDALLREYAVKMHLAEKIHSVTGVSIFAYNFQWEYHAEEDRYPLRFLLPDDNGTTVIETVIVKAIDDTDGKEKFFVDVNPTVILQ